MWMTPTSNHADGPHGWYFTDVWLFCCTVCSFTLRDFPLTFLPMFTGLLPSYYSSSFPLFSHPPIPGGFSSVSLWSSHSIQKSNQRLASCLKPVWMSAPPVTLNATRRPPARATRTCASFCPTRLSTPTVNLPRRLSGSMPWSPLQTPAPPPRQGHPASVHSHTWGESARSLAMMAVLALQDRTFCSNTLFQCPSNCPLVVLVPWWGTAMSSPLLIVFTMAKTM